MKYLKELRKHFITILMILLIGLNSFNIAKNVFYIEKNAQAIIGNATVIETLGYCIKILAKEVRLIKNLNLRDKTGITKILEGMIDTIEIQTKKLEMVCNTINEMNLKPSYKYLRSVTVFIEVKQKDYMDILNEKASKILLDLVNIDKIKPDWIGTGVIVKIDNEHTYVLTNKHVAGGLLKDNEDGSQVIIMISDLRTSRVVAEVVKMHEIQDLALLRFKGKLMNKQAIKGIACPNIAESVYTVGQSLCRPYTYGEGVFSSTVVWHDVYQLPIMGGCSGSGIFNRNGELIGLVYSISISGNIYDIPHANSIKAIYIKEFLEENNVAK